MQILNLHPPIQLIQNLQYDSRIKTKIGPCGMKIDWNHKYPQHYISCYLQSKQIHDKYIRYLIIITLICLNFFLTDNTSHWSSYPFTKQLKRRIPPFWKLGSRQASWPKGFWSLLSRCKPIIGRFLCTIKNLTINM